MDRASTAIQAIAQRNPIKRNDEGHAFSQNL